jgi:glycerophosphoryl diester phosphodiesterase
MKKHKVLKIIGIILASILLLWAIINIIPPKKTIQNNPFVLEKGQKTMIAAHRGGSASNPENTMLAFREAVNTFKVDIIESDLYLTKDGYLVYNHDSYIDETCNINGDISLDAVKELCNDKANRHYISDMTLAELEQYNFGYYFEDKNGKRIYKDAENYAELGLQIATADKLFEEFYETHPNLLFIVEIKNGGDLGFKACKILSDTLDKYPEYRDQIVIGTFNDEVEAELKEKYPDLLRGASMGTAKQFVITQYAGVNLFDDSDFSCLQIPMSYDIGVEIPLASRSLIRRAHRRNMAVQYWTINDADDMRKLINMGCDCIMTDDPELMRQVLDEMQK